MWYYIAWSIAYSSTKPHSVVWDKCEKMGWEMLAPILGAQIKFWEHPPHMGFLYLGFCMINFGWDMGWQFIFWMVQLDREFYILYQGRTVRFFRRTVEFNIWSMLHILCTLSFVTIQWFSHKRQKYCKFGHIYFVSFPLSCWLIWLDVISVIIRPIEGLKQTRDGRERGSGVKRATKTSLALYQSKHSHKSQCTVWASSS